MSKDMVTHATAPSPLSNNKQRMSDPTPHIGSHAPMHDRTPSRRRCYLPFKQMSSSTTLKHEHDIAGLTCCPCFPRRLLGYLRDCSGFPEVSLRPCLHQLGNSPPPSVHVLATAHIANDVHPPANLSELTLGLYTSASYVIVHGLVESNNFCLR